MLQYYQKYSVEILISAKRASQLIEAVSLDSGDHISIVSHALSGIEPKRSTMSQRAKDVVNWLSGYMSGDHVIDVILPK